MSGTTRNLVAQFGMKADKNSRLYIPAGGGGSFTISPIRFLDNVFNIINPLTAEVGYRFYGATFNPGKFIFFTAGGGFGEVSDRPQWHIDEPATVNAGQYGVKFVEDLGPDILDGSPDGPVAPTPGKVWQMNTQRDFTMTRSGPGAVKTNNSVLEFVEWANQSNILARATITLISDRS